MKINFVAPILRKLAILMGIIVVSCLATQAQNNYWQQEVHYRIDVSLNDVNNTLKGTETIDYVNNSPDTLHFIWFHLWPNAYKDKTTAFYRQLEKLGNLTDKIRKENGYIDSLNFTVNGVTAAAEPEPGNIDVLKVMLKDNLYPGSHVTIATAFFIKLPPYESRFGYSKGKYIITQWYPKPAVYDQKGWHPMPYLDQGEFYGEFGSFTVNISVPSNYVVAATGSLLTPEELSNYKNIGAANFKMYKQHDNSNPKALMYASRDASSIKTLQYYAKDVHDFAWFADKNFIIQYDTISLKPGNTTDVFSYKQPGGNFGWENSIYFIKDAVRSYSNWIGEYPYPVVSAVEGPSNISSGGMEYPMITLITMPYAGREELDATIAHEVGHNWFYGVLGTNERDHAWMDEGINTYYQFRYEAEKYRSNSLMGDILPAAAKQKPSDEYLKLIYRTFSERSIPTPIDIPSEKFSSTRSYVYTVYIKASIWTYLLESEIGKKTFDEAMQAFYKQWQFRHPYPEDMKTSFEKTSNRKLGHIFSLLEKNGSLY